MPIYEYRCSDCGKISEILHRQRTEETLPVCSHCGSHRMERIISALGSIVMGGSSPKGATCCGREERCSAPPCSDGGSCRRDR